MRAVFAQGHGEGFEDDGRGQGIAAEDVGAPVVEVVDEHGAVLGGFPVSRCSGPLSIYPFIHLSIIHYPLSIIHYPLSIPFHSVPFRFDSLQ